MAVIDSTSTTADIEAAYLDNCGYEEDASIVKAQRFITACRAMLRRGGLTGFRVGAQSSTYSPEQLERQILRAKQFIASEATPANGGAGARAFSFAEYRT
ncbi:MAG: hypothetical protein AMJ84_06520 [Acidithiobacillales bacterium SM23_46]|nr:MAG: hypothetical protein AMJ84_06520 [Acidithiobacillales bacterium SM23_46]